MSRSELSAQIKVVRSGLDVHNHTFFNQTATALTKRIEDQIGLKLTISGKAVKGQVITALLTGESADPKVVAEAAVRVRQLMQDLKNPTAMLRLIHGR